MFISNNVKKKLSHQDFVVKSVMTDIWGIRRGKVSLANDAGCNDNIDYNAVGNCDRWVREIVEKYCRLLKCYWHKVS